jgi:hypothetical protein
MPPCSPSGQWNSKAAEAKMWLTSVLSVWGSFETPWKPHRAHAAIPQTQTDSRQTVSGMECCGVLCGEIKANRKPAGWVGSLRGREEAAYASRLGRCTGIPCVFLCTIVRKLKELRSVGQ